MTIAAVEAGGTKFVCALIDTETADRPAILARASIPTGEPEATIGTAAEFFRGAMRECAAQAGCGGQGADRRGVDRIGIGSFGPADLDPESPTWGFITSTPKKGWRGVDLAGPIAEALGAPAAFDTDVGAAALGERTWGAGRGMDDLVYITVGTGIGGGIVSGGRLLHGSSHPETGHIKVGRIEGDEYPGLCPFHSDCLEGLASGPAIAARWGSDPRTFPESHPAWDLEARYLARGFATLVLTLAPRRIVLGGGVGLRPGLAEAVRRHLRAELAGYVEGLDSEAALAGLVVRAELGADAGILGCAALATAPGAYLRGPA